MGQPCERFVPKIEWRWDAIPPSVYELIQRTLETGNVKYLEPLGLPDTAFKQTGAQHESDKDTPKCEQMFILNKYLDQVEVACKFATRCQLYERKIAELEHTLAEEKKASCALRQKYQVILIPGMCELFSRLFASGPCPCQFTQMLQIAMKDVVKAEKYNKYMRHFDVQLKETASLNCFMAEFYRTHILRISTFLDGEVRKMNQVLGADRDTALSQVVDTVRLIRLEFGKYAASLSTIFRDGNGEVYMFPPPPVVTYQYPAHGPLEAGPCAREKELDELANVFETLTCAQPSCAAEGVAGGVAKSAGEGTTMLLTEEKVSSSPEPSHSCSPQLRKKSRRKNKSKNKH